MKYLVLYSVCLVTLVTADPVPHSRLSLEFINEGRIVGGETAKDGQFPFMVILKVTQGQLICGGTLLTKRTVLSAAHCIEKSDPSKFKVSVGTNSLTSGGTDYKVSKFISHEKFGNFSHDIGLIILTEAVALGPLVKLTQLPPADLNPQQGDVATAIGWGRTSHGGNLAEQLQYVNVKIWSHEECKNMSNVVDDTHICVEGNKGQGICGGDSGSALINKDGVQIGIPIWFINECAAGFADGFTRISYFIDWINKNKVE